MIARKGEWRAVLRLAALLAGIGMGTAQAETPLDRSLERYFEACAGAVSTVEITDCLSRQYERADGELNAVWPHVLALIDSSSELPADVRRAWKDGITKAQRAWVQYKDAECRASAPFKFYQGTQANVESLGCLVRVTAIRLGELKEYLAYRQHAEKQ